MDLKMATLHALILLASAFVTLAQRPSFAGFRPIGYPEIVNKTTTTPSGLQDKFGEVTTQRLPIEAQGDRELVDRLSKLPIDKQPFWLINWQALEAQREKPQTYPLKPSPFLDIDVQNPSSNPVNNPVANTNPGFVNSNVGFVNPNPSFVNANPGIIGNFNDRYGTEINTGATSGNKDRVTSASNNKKVNDVTHPGLSKPSQEENEFEDIEVKKYPKKH